MPTARVLLAGLALLVTACAGASADAACDERLPGVRAGLCPTTAEDRVAAPVDPMPVVGEDRDLSLADFDGQVVVLNFWASWCGPCRVEQPELNDAADLLAEDGVAFLGVNIEDGETNALAHIREFDIPYPHLYDPANEYAAQFRGVSPRTIPSTIIIDRDGRVAVRIIGLTTFTEVTMLADLVASES